MNGIYGKERTLFVIALVISLVFWIAVIVLTVGIALAYLLLAFVAYLFIQSAFISWLKGNGVRITSSQFPELKEQFDRCCAKLEMPDQPEVYLVNSEGILNALATKFLGKHFIVLYSEVVEALEDRPEALNFYIGHELGHVKQKHLNWGPVLWPAMLLPHLGAAYSRAREYTCDLYGLACCGNREDAERALAVLASGDALWKRLNLEQYRAQVAGTGGFWMSFHEYTADYPWLVKRLEHLRAVDQSSARDFPRRNAFAFILACLVPRLGVGGGAGLLVVVAMVGVLAAIAIPAYQDYTVRAAVATAMNDTAPIREQLVQHYAATQAWPATLEEAGYSAAIGSEAVSSAYLDDEGDLVIVLGPLAGPAAGKMFGFTPYLDDNQKVQMACRPIDVEPKHVPVACR